MWHFGKLAKKNYLKLQKKKKETVSRCDYGLRGLLTVFVGVGLVQLTTRNSSGKNGSLF